MDVQLNEIINYLSMHGYNCMLNEDDESIIIDTNICGEKIILKCIFPFSFPYTFPKIYIEEESRDKIPLIPHINNGGKLCLFDENIAYPNSKKPNEVVLESVKKAIKIIEDGLNGTNKDDFIDEFKAYWDNASTLYAYTLFDVNEKPRFLYLYVNGENLYIGENKSKLIEYLKIVKQINVSENGFDKCIYLPLDCKLIPPYPKKNHEFYSLVMQNKSLFDFYYRFDPPLLDIIYVELFLL